MPIRKPQKQNAIFRTPQPPDLEITTHAASLPGDRLDDQTSYERIELSECSLDEQAAEQIVVQQSHLRRVGLGRTQLRSPEFVDVRFEACTLAGADWQKPQLTRVEMIDASLVGARFIDATIDDMLLRSCNCELAAFWTSRFRVVRFERCNFRRASFRGSDLSGVIFHECDLLGADLRGTKLVGADLRTSTITGMAVGIDDLRGAIISPEQSVDLIELLGVTVKSAYE